ncbi:MAG TPA: MotA/TolQ/ExbB proton channel family protein [Candidatus Avirikenella pullistercoris]|nr:MotA/TolQ/ExbB proton channel family protein [Candidatus Avirikenella pullistercoris]
MDFINNALYWLSTGMLVPVIVFLLFFFVRSLMMIGGFYGRYVNRSKVNVKIHRQLDERSVPEFLDTLGDYPKSNELIASLERVSRFRDSAPALDRQLGDYEIVADKELGKSKLLVKIGPILGLMGTLIPMGPALTGLATGDVESMAQNMQVAFATTVVGLIIGAVGFITLQVKQRWYADDMNILEYVVESLKEHKK